MLKHTTYTVPTTNHFTVSTSIDLITFNNFNVPVIFPGFSVTPAISSLHVGSSVYLEMIPLVITLVTMTTADVFAYLTGMATTALAFAGLAMMQLATTFAVVRVA